MTVTKIEYRGSGFYGNNPTRIVEGEAWRQKPFGSVIDESFTGTNTLLRPEEIAIPLNPGRRRK
jgi:hypothetical protein